MGGATKPFGEGLMRTRTKIVLVIGGYIAALGAAVAAGWLYDLRVSKLPYDTSGGMYAGGQLLQSLGAFLVVAIVPTVLGLSFVRRHTGLWNGLAIASVAFAAVGLIAVLSPLVTRTRTGSVPVLLFDLLALSQLLGVPFWAVAFALFALFAPTKEARGKLVVALGLELVIAVCAAIHWFVPHPPF
jgi:hypothetical protein